MFKQVAPSDVARNTNIEFEVMFTLRNQQVNIGSIGGNYVINTNGLIYELSPGKGTAKVSIVGGLGTFINEKAERPAYFYLSTPQKRTLSHIMKFLSTNSDANITSNSEWLEFMLNGEYNNFRG